MVCVHTTTHACVPIYVPNYVARATQSAPPRSSCRRNRGVVPAVAVSMSVLFHEAVYQWEVSELVTDPTLGRQAAGWYVAAEMMRQPQAAWKPINKYTVAKCHDGKPMNIGGFGGVPGMTSSHPKKYIPNGVYTHFDGSYVGWLYVHCRNTHCLIIRKVQASPEIHLEMQPRPPCPILYPCREHTTLVTAVAEDDTAIMDLLIFEDVRFQQMKAALKKKCIERGLCTQQTDLTVFHDNIPMTSNNILRAEYDANYKRNRLPKVIASHDGNFVSGYTYMRHQASPQSRPPRPTRTEKRAEMILEGDTPASADYATTSESDQQPAGRDPAAAARAAASAAIQKVEDNEAQREKDVDKAAALVIVAETLHTMEANGATLADIANAEALMMEDEEEETMEADDEVNSQGDGDEVNSQGEVVGFDSQAEDSEAEEMNEPRQPSPKKQKTAVAGSNQTSGYDGGPSESCSTSAASSSSSNKLPVNQTRMVACVVRPQVGAFAIPEGQNPYAARPSSAIAPIY